MSLSLLDVFWYINILLVFSVIFLEHKNASATWSWIMLMLFVPIIGFILYILIGQDLHKRKTFSQKEEEDRFSSFIHTQQISLLSPSAPYTNPLISNYEDLINIHLLAHEALYTEDNNVTLFTDGKLLFKDLFQHIKAAKKYIHLEYYIIHNDKLGYALQKLLIKKAHEGVDIFILYDDMGCFTTSKKFFKEMKQAGIKVACFFPSFVPFLKLRANYRNHRKIIIIDGSISYLGGFNVGVEYLGCSKRFGYWRDTHIRVEGSAVPLINLQFLLDRRFATGENVSLINYISNTNTHSAAPLGMQIVSSGPDSKYASIRNGFIKMINSAKKSIFIQTPYFVPDEGVLTALKLAALSGIDVRIMIPNKPDHIFVYWATYANMGEMLRHGGRCFTYNNGFLHSKTIVIDETICSIGSANFDIRSFNLNFELNAFIYDSDFSKNLASIFIKDLSLCQEITLSDYHKRSLMIKFKESISRLISPIL